MRIMTDVEMEHYLKQVERRGRALRLPDSELEKWKEQFDKITVYLRTEYKRFVTSKIVRRGRYADVRTFNAFVEKEENGLIASAIKLLDQGDAENLDWICWLMHLKYMTMWKEKHNAGLR